MSAVSCRLLFIWHAPFTFDEGAYLYDAKLIAAHVLPGGDVLTKTPWVALLFAGSIKFFGPGLFAARFISLIADIGTAAALYYLGKQLDGHKLGFAAGVVWLLAAGPIVFNIYGHTQAVAACMVTWSIALWVKALQVDNNKSLGWAWGAGVCLGLAYASRKIAVAVILPGVFLWVMHKKPGRKFLGLLTGVMTVVVPWLIGIDVLYGWAGVREASGMGYGSIAERYLTHPELIASWGGGLPILAAIGVMLLGPLVALAAGAWQQKSVTVIAGVGGLWLAGLAVLYSTWPAFLPEYVADFFSPLILLAAWGILGWIGKRGKIGWVIIGIVGILNGGTIWYAYYHPPVGSYAISTITKVVTLLKTSVPYDQPILTAAVIMPYASGHRVYGDISHPLWYRYRFIATDAKQAFLPPFADVKAQVEQGEVPWVLSDPLTQYTYFSTTLVSPARQPDVWQEVEHVSSGKEDIKQDNFFTLFQRR